MFTIIISEKGGAERREAFDKNEINVGRVQGNDLMLPKGNVSKHHARLLFRDGRFIVTDLKSTNGTYVNGRKISQATIVREGDKIYIGDFVLRLETAGQGAAVGGEATYLPADDSQGSTPARLGPMPRDGATPAPPRQWWGSRLRRRSQRHQRRLPR
jgi:pilus assembly protein CpaF